MDHAQSFKQNSLADREPVKPSKERGMSVSRHPKKKVASIVLYHLELVQEPTGKLQVERVAMVESGTVA